MTDPLKITAESGFKPRTATMTVTVLLDPGRIDEFVKVLQDSLMDVAKAMEPFGFIGAGCRVQTEEEARESEAKLDADMQKFRASRGLNGGSVRE